MIPTLSVNALLFRYIFVFAMSTLGAMFRLATLVMPRFRKSLLLYGIRGKPSHDAVNAILDNSRLGDWFVLKQVTLLKKNLKATKLDNFSLLR